MTTYNNYHCYGLSNDDEIKYQLKKEDQEKAERKELAKAIKKELITSEKEKMEDLSGKDFIKFVIVIVKFCFFPIVFPIILLIWINKCINSKSQLQNKESDLDRTRRKLRNITEEIIEDEKENNKKDKEFRIRFLKEKYKNDEEFIINVKKNESKCKKDLVEPIKSTKKENDKINHNLSIIGIIINFCTEQRIAAITIIFLIGVLIYLPFHEVLINWISPPPVIPESWFVFWK